MNRPQVVLTGSRAVGKTTTGRRLAESVNRPFLDLDARVLADLSADSVVEAWRRLGEDAWRASEVRMLATALAEPSSIIALGGGVVTIPAARTMLADARRRGRAVVIWLQASPEVVIDRLERERGDRPSLTGADPAQEIAEVMRERARDYGEVSDLTIDVSGRTVESVVSEIQASLDERRIDR